MTYDDKTRAVLCCHLMRESFAHPRFGEDEPSPEFVFFQAKQVVDCFDFEILPVGILERRYFGDRLPLKSVQDLDEVTLERLRGISEKIANGE